MIFKGLKFGKSKDKGKEKAQNGNKATSPITELEEKLKDRTNNLKETEQKLMELSDEVDDMTEIEVTKVKPHGPI